MNHTQVIGINGFKRAGKGETGQAIASVAADYAQTATLLGFADKVKILGARTLGFMRSNEECIALMDEAKEKWIFDIRVPTPSLMAPDARLGWAYHDLTGRQYLQHLGTEARKVFGADFWVDQVLPAAPYDKREVDRRYGTTYVVLTDLRFENEAERVLALGGEVWEVIRPGTGSDGHESEQPLPRRLVTRQIDNSGSLLDLRYQVERALGL